MKAHNLETLEAELSNALEQTVDALVRAHAAEDERAVMSLANALFAIRNAQMAMLDVRIEAHHEEQRQ